MGKAYLVLSGKGGVGKTTISASLSLLLAERGLDVALIDADVGLRCADQHLGLQDKVIYDAGDVLGKRCPLQKAFVRPPEFEKMALIAAPQLLSPSEVDKREMERLICILKRQFDFVLIDCPAGISRGIKNVWNAADEALVVATADDACLRDTERVFSLLLEKKQLHADLILNRIDRYLIWRGDMKRPGDIAAALDATLLGAIPNDEEIYRSLLRHKPVAYHCEAATQRAFRLLADRLMGMEHKLPRYCR